MNILHILHINHLGNGITSVVLELSFAQEALGHKVRVLNVRKEAVDIERFHRCLSKESFVRELDDFKPDFVIFHGIFYKQIKSYPKIVNNRNIPYVIEPHGAYSYDNYSKNYFKKYLFKKIFLDNTLKNSSGIIFLNENERQNFALEKASSPSYIIPNGCNPKDIPVMQTNNKKVSLLFLSRIAITHKGLDILLHSIKYLINNNPDLDFELNMYGPGHDEDLEKLNELIKPISSHVKYYGPVYGKDKECLFSKADIFILTSRFEGFPMSILESLSYGCPCIVSKGTNVENIIKDQKCGWVTEKLSVQNLAKTIHDGIKEYQLNPLLYRTNALNASRLFNWEKIAADSIEIYKHIIDNYLHS